MNKKKLNFEFILGLLILVMTFFAFLTIFSKISYFKTRKPDPNPTRITRTRQEPEGIKPEPEPNPRSKTRTRPEPDFCYPNPSLHHYLETSFAQLFLNAN